MSHVFKPGQTVRMAPAVAARQATRIEYRIVQRMPERGGELQYRVKAAHEPFERVVSESALEKV